MLDGTKPVEMLYRSVNSEMEIEELSKPVRYIGTIRQKGLDWIGCVVTGTKSGPDDQYVALFDPFDQHLMKGGDGYCRIQNYEPQPNDWI